MMQFFRSSAKPIILVTTIAFVVWLVYDLSGLGTGGGLLTSTSVGKVNGTSVDSRSFQEAVQQAIDSRQRQSGASMSLEETVQIRDQVWNQFIQDIIFRAEYKKHGITVSPDEIAEAIRNSPPREAATNPDFQTNGTFDPSKYQRWLTSSSAAQYIPYLESQYAEEILRSKLLQGVIGDVFVSDASLWERYRDDKEQVKVGALVIDPAMAVPATGIQVSDAEIDAYYRAHKDEFKRSKAAYLSYLAVPRLPDASDSAAALSRARALREEIQKGAPFAEVAQRESSDTVSGRSGGELGEMNSTTGVDQDFAKAAMSLPLKTLSEPVRSQFGYHLIEVASRKGDNFTARHILVPIEVTGAHRDLLDRRADSLEQLAAERLEPAALDTAAGALGLSIQKLGPISEATSVYAPETGRIPDVSIWAFQAKPGEESPVIEAEQSYVVFRLDSAQSEGVPPLSAIKNEVAGKLRLDKQRAAAIEMGRRLAETAKSGTPLKQLAQANGVTYRELGPMSRLRATFQLPAQIGAAFGAPRVGASGPVSADDGVYLFQELERSAADSVEFTKNLSQIRNDATQAARQSRVRAYVLALRNNAKIVDRRADLYKTNAQAAAAAPPPIQ
ncbi:MAG: hypothetical protein HOP28_00920 [Gemmatimonadales bacterium]|nr:hypothetical protein [Gemmatimonadales bacterium]